MNTDYLEKRKVALRVYREASWGTDLSLYQRLAKFGVPEQVASHTLDALVIGARYFE